MLAKEKNLKTTEDLTASVRSSITKTKNSLMKELMNDACLRTKIIRIQFISCSLFLRSCGINQIFTELIFKVMQAESL